MKIVSSRLLPLLLVSVLIAASLGSEAHRAVWAQTLDTLEEVVETETGIITSEDTGVTEGSEAAALENIKKVIEKNITTEKVKEVIEQVARRKRGFVGQVTRVSEDMITLRVGAESTIVSVGAGTILTDGADEIDVEVIAVDDWVSVIGFIDEDDQLEPVRVSVLEENPYPTNIITHIGSISSIEDTTVTVLSRSDGTERTFEIDDDTLIEDSAGTVLELDELESLLTALVIAQESDDDEPASITRLRLLIEKADLEPAASDSAEPA